MSYAKITVPVGGQKIIVNPDFSLNVPARPIIPFIEGDGIGVDVTPVMRKVVDAALKKAYGDKKSIAWMEVYAGEKPRKCMAKICTCPKIRSRPCANTRFPSRGRWRRQLAGAFVH